MVLTSLSITQLQVDSFDIQKNTVTLISASSESALHNQSFLVDLAADTGTQLIHNIKSRVGSAEPVALAKEETLIEKIDQFIAEAKSLIEEIKSKKESTGYLDLVRTLKTKKIDML